MAKLGLSSALNGVQGQFGGLVLRLIRGIPTLSVAPDMSKVKWSPAQKAHRERFRLAVAHARAVMRDPQQRAFYEAEAARQGKRPFDLAVSEYFRDRKIENRE